MAKLTDTLVHLAALPASAVAGLWPQQGEWDYEAYSHLPDDGWRYEVIRGVLHMSPAPSTRHQAILRNLAFFLGLHLRQYPIGRLLFAPVDVILAPNLATPVQPDLLVVLEEHAHEIRENCVEGVPDLLVEVLSPSNWLSDRREKYEIYAAAGVTEYWIVDPRLETLEVFVLRGDGYELLGRYGAEEELRSELLENFRPRAEELFAE